MPHFSPHGYIRTYLNLLRVTPDLVVETFTTPATQDDNALVTTVAMGNKAYALALTAFTDGYAHNVTLKRTAVSTGDTPGVVTVTGTDNAGAVISEILTVSASDATEVVGDICFKTITSVVGSAWVIGGTTADTIIVGMGGTVGLGQAASADGDVLNVYDATSFVATATPDGDGDGTVSGTHVFLTGANATLNYVVVYRPVAATALTAVTAAILATSAAIGFNAEVEEFGFRVSEVLAGTSGTTTYTLCDSPASTGNVIATVVLTVALGAVGYTFKTVTPTNAYTHLYDASTLTVKRTATGTAFTSGAGTFYVKLRQRTQA